MGRPWPNILSGMRGGRMKRREHPAGNRGPDPDAGPGSRAARISRHLPKDQRLLVIPASHSSAKYGGNVLSIQAFMLPIVKQCNY
jgi:hypothetical protein